MNTADDRNLQIEDLRERLSRLSRASVRINESLDFDSVLQGVLESARSLTDAIYGVMVLFDESLQLQDFLTSGLTLEQADRLRNTAGGERLFERIGGFSEPVRHRSFEGYVRELGLPDFDSPVEASTGMSFLCAPITHQGRPLGIVYLGEKDGGEEFTQEDEETLVMFASQAALVIANARYHRDQQRARADLEALVNTAPVGVVVLDAGTGVPVYVNREMLRIGSELTSPDFTAEEMLGAISVRRGDGREVSMRDLPLSTVLRAGEAARAEEIVISVPDGRSVTAILNATPILSDEGEVASFVVTLQDMTPLEDLDRLRADFLGMVSHELRAPLASIKGSVATLLGSGDSLDPSESELFFQIIDRQADHMSGLISDLLDVARIEAGALSVSPEPVDAAVLLDEARNAYLSSGGRGNLQFDVSPDLSRVAADRRRIVQVIGNLLSNADRNSPDRSAIVVSVEQRDVHVEFSVADEGDGIPAERLPHLFRKFSRPAGEAGESRAADSGLGLAISRGIVEAHGGRIWAESDGPGRGARFTFSLPVADEAGHPATPRPVRSSSSSAQHGSGGIRVLIVDDDPQTLRHVRDSLTGAGYEPFTTGDPGAVAGLLAEKRPHLVLLDLLLPGTDGIELMERLPLLSEVPVIFLSAYGRDQIVARALEAGADDYIVKPFSPTELVARVQTVLRRRTAAETPEPSEPYRSGELTIDYAERRVYLRDHPLRVTDMEYRMLFELSVNAGRVLTHAHLLERVWGPAHSGRTGAVRSVVRSLRRRLGDDASNPTYIINEPRVGYRMPKADWPP